jgi:hypothetical protein
MLTALLGEVAIRVLVGAPIIWKYPQEHYAHDPEIGHRLVPNQTAYTHSELFTTNSQGIRAPEIDTQIRPDHRRILALGDSQTAGDGLSLEATWPAQVEVALNDGTQGGGWQVLNAGISGSAPWQHAILLKRLAEQYELDGVILALYVNDVMPRPKNIEAYVVTNTLARRLGYVLKRSALFTACWSARRSLWHWIQPKANSDFELRILRGDPDPLIEHGWRDVETSLKEIRDFCHERGIFFELLVLPRRDQVSGIVLETNYNRRAAAVAESLDVQAIDPLDGLRTAYAEHGRNLFITWDGHNSAISNRVIAARVASALSSNGHALWDRLRPQPHNDHHGVQ